MSDDKRQNARTQGRFENGDGVSGHKSYESDSAKSHRKKKNPKAFMRQSKDAEATTVLWTDDHGGHHFPQLEPPVPAKVISSSGLHVLSNTENGESRIYFDPDFMGCKEGDSIFNQLLKNVEWSDKKIVVRGQEYRQPRLVAWFGPLPYTYSGITLKARGFPDTIMEIKKSVERSLKKQDINVELNSVLLNLYRNGKDSVAWHSDDELSMGIHPTIASVSLGEQRRFELRRKPEDPTESKADAEYVVHLIHGSLIVMDGVMQQDWQHRVPKEYHDRQERINLTFRTVFSTENVPFSLDTRDCNMNQSRLASPQIERKPFQYEDESFPSLGDSSSTKPRPQREWSRGSRRKRGSGRPNGTGANETHESNVREEDSSKPHYNSELNDSWKLDDPEVKSPEANLLNEPAYSTWEQDNGSETQDNPCCSSKDADQEKEISTSGTGKAFDNSSVSVEETVRECSPDSASNDCHYQSFDPSRSKLNVNVSDFVPRQQPTETLHGHPGPQKYQSNVSPPSSIAHSQGLSCVTVAVETHIDEGEVSNKVTVGPVDVASNYVCEQMDSSMVPEDNYTSRGARPRTHRGRYSRGSPNSKMQHSPSKYPTAATDAYHKEGKILADIYNYIRANLQDIPFSNRDRAELEVLFVVIEEASEPLRVNVMKAISRRFDWLLSHAESFYSPVPHHYNPQRRGGYHGQYQHYTNRTFRNKARY